MKSIKLKVCVTFLKSTILGYCNKFIFVHLTNVILQKSYFSPDLFAEKEM